jgi:hypothetical protein
MFFIDLEDILFRPMSTPSAMNRAPDCGFPNGQTASVARNRPPARNGIFGCRDRRPKIHPRDRYCRQRPGTLKIGGKIPAEAASFRSTMVSAVREDWMVEVVGHKLATHHPVIEPVSTKTNPRGLAGQDICDISLSCPAWFEFLKAKAFSHNKGSRARQTSWPSLALTKFTLRHR